VVLGRLQDNQGGTAEQPFVPVRMKGFSFLFFTFFVSSLSLRKEGKHATSISIHDDFA
jgi:hypothetical protein